MAKIRVSDLRRPRDNNPYELALWADMLQVHRDELFYAYRESIAKTNAALGLTTALI